VKFYLDTSVFGGYFDDEFKEDTYRLFSEIINGTYSVIFTNLTVEELIKAPANVRGLLKYIEKHSEIYDVDEEMTSLAKLYVKEGALTKKYISDATHIAAATILKADVLVSWNFKHMVNFFRVRLYNGINFKNGYSEIDIRSPREVLK
jgi:predicted nucleic acid-binding protein